MDERLLALAGRIELLASPLTDLKDFPEADVTLVEGAVAQTWGWLTRWVCDLIACRSGAPVRYFPQHTSRLQTLAVRANPVRLWALYQTLLMAGRHLQHPLNPQLLLESWLLRYALIEDRP
jgi:hypothetical protein